MHICITRLARSPHTCCVAGMFTTQASSPQPVHHVRAGMMKWLPYVIYAYGRRTFTFTGGLSYQNSTQLPFTCFGMHENWRTTSVWVWECHCESVTMQADRGWGMTANGVFSIPHCQKSGMSGTLVATFCPLHFGITVGVWSQIPRSLIDFSTLASKRQSTAERRPPLITRDFAAHIKL